MNNQPAPAAANNVVAALVVHDGRPNVTEHVDEVTDNTQYKAHFHVAEISGLRSYPLGTVFETGFFNTLGEALLGGLREVQTRYIAGEFNR